ncbi:hypothetical protein [Glycomyces rhizosphaerae]|uniref:Uncharacterized protein n=1 Tax=Glycomyces rhizosphaerae TaxID=2054422 RepID=A0ABV7Q1K5_9ACTN
MAGDREGHTDLLSNEKTMRKLIFVAFAALALMFAGSSTAWAGSPHFINVSYTISGDTLTVEGKEAGLGNIDQVNIEVTATAECVNRGGNNPNAENKTDVSGDVDVPVQNGKAIFSVTLEADFQPDCAPPMRVVWSDIVVTDTTNGISKTLR